MDKISWKSTYYDILFHEVREQNTRKAFAHQESLNLHRQHYISEIPARFLCLQTPAELEDHKELIVRDGIIDLLVFFQKYSVKKVRPHLYVAKELHPLVPDEWRKKISYYEYYTLHKPAEIYGVFIYGTEKDRGLPNLKGPHWICDLNTKWAYADSHLTHALLSGGHWYPYKKNLKRGKQVEVSAYHGLILGKD